QLSSLASARHCSAGNARSGGGAWSVLALETVVAPVQEGARALMPHRGRSRRHLSRPPRRRTATRLTERQSRRSLPRDVVGSLSYPDRRGRFFPIGLLPVLGQEFVEPGCRMIVDAAQAAGEPSLWVDIVELGGGDQGINVTRRATRCVWSA